MKTIADLTDEQLIEIATLAYGNAWKENVSVTMEKYTHPKFTKWIGVKITAVDTELPDARMGTETMRLWEDLDVDFIQDWDGGRGVSNQYKIFQLLNQWEIQPV